MEPTAKLNVHFGAATKVFSFPSLVHERRYHDAIFCRFLRLMQYPASCFWDYIHIYRSRVGVHATGRIHGGGMRLTVFVYCIYLLLGRVVFGYYGGNWTNSVLHTIGVLGT